jgi:ABC-type sugar transport system ATPase subunit
LSKLQVSSATVRFGGTVALDACSLTVDAGELVVVLGPSGSGKSTLLRAIAGLTPLTDGRVQLGDRDITGLPPSQRDVSMVFQGYALFPHLDVAANIGFGLRARKTPNDRITDAVTEIAQALGIIDLLHRRPHQLSGGERQRVALARALVREPAIALLDEPLASLDAPLRVSARSQIARLQRSRGTTMLHVTHDQNEAMALGDRVAIMRDGKVVQVGTPTEIYQAPADTFVAGFVGNPAMNLIPGEAWNSGDGVIGVRPEDVIITGDDPEARSAKVIRIERLGDHDLVALQIQGREAELLARVAAGSTLTPDARVAVKARRTTKFDQQGNRIP